MIFPYVGAVVILGGLATFDPRTLTGAALAAYREVETRTVVHTYLGLAAALVVVAAVVWTRRKRLRETHAKTGSIVASLDLLSRRWFSLGALSIFVYVGAEVAIGLLIVSYLMQPSILGLAQSDAGRLAPFYWAGALVGRFVGSAVLRAVAPGKVLAGVAVAAIVLLTVAVTAGGATAGYALLAIGLANSVMFPTIFTLASEGLGTRAADRSGVICVAIVGGAIIPPLTGSVADAASLSVALAVPTACYAIIAAYGVDARRPV